jgi:hypothetical protein
VSTTVWGSIETNDTKEKCDVLGLQDSSSAPVSFSPSKNLQVRGVWLDSREKPTHPMRCTDTRTRRPTDERKRRDQRVYCG